MKKIINTELIIQYIKENNLSKAAFCKLCKISMATLNKILADNSNLRLLPLFKITKTMKVKFDELFSQLK